MCVVYTGCETWPPRPGSPDDSLSFRAVAQQPLAPSPRYTARGGKISPARTATSLAITVIAVSAMGIVRDSFSEFLGGLWPVFSKRYWRVIGKAARSKEIVDDSAPWRLKNDRSYWPKNLLEFASVASTPAGALAETGLDQLPTPLRPRAA